MSIVYACIAPHGGHLLSGASMPGTLRASRAAMAAMERELYAAAPETIAVLTPHGVAVEGAISIGLTPTGAGTIEGAQVELPTDRELAGAWAEDAAAVGIPMAPLIGRDPSLALPLDWGVIIPVALLAHSLSPLPSLVVCCPSREVTRGALVAFGEALVSASERIGRRTALIISADQGHGHAADGPYGHTPASADYDSAMVDAVRTGDLESLLTWDETFPEEALADSYWQTLTLLGVSRRVPLRSVLRSYEVDHYFGMLCASFLPHA